MPTDILIKNANVIVTMDDHRRELNNHDMYLSEGKIIEIGQNLTYSKNVLRILADNCIVTPGLVNTHHHLFQTMTRAVPAGQDALLFGWL